MRGTHAYLRVGHSDHDPDPQDWEGYDFLLLEIEEAFCVNIFVIIVINYIITVNILSLSSFAEAISKTKI